MKYIAILCTFFFLGYICSLGIAGLKCLYQEDAKARKEHEANQANPTNSSSKEDASAIE